MEQLSTELLQSFVSLSTKDGKKIQLFKTPFNGKKENPSEEPFNRYFISTNNNKKFRVIEESAKSKEEMLLKATIQGEKVKIYIQRQMLYLKDSDGKITSYLMSNLRHQDIENLSRHLKHSQKKHKQIK